MEKIEKLEMEVEERKKHLNTFKTLVNQLLIDSGEPPKYNDASSIVDLPRLNSDTISFNSNVGNRGELNIKNGEFFTMPIAKAIVDIFRRKGEPMLLSDIYNALIKGGSGRIKNEDQLKLILLKSKHFARLPDKQHYLLASNDKLKKQKIADEKHVEEESKKVIPE